jgi:UDP-N-acetylmuramate dehydrogenase
MMAASAPIRPPLLDRLPVSRGELRAAVPLAKATWFQVGGSAEVLFRPLDLEDLVTFLKAKPADVPLTVLGAGTNVLVRDGGIEGVVVRLGKSFAQVQVDDDRVIAGGSAMDVNVARAAAAAGITGLEFLSGVPGTIGGAIRMNAGAYGAELSDAIVSAEAIDPNGERRVLKTTQLGFTYRGCSIPEDWIFISAVLRGQKDLPAAIKAKMANVQVTRAETQPIRSKTGGSTFANPTEPEAAGVKAWELIDQAGCRGLKRGDAMVSNLHCNFLINNGAASATDMESLGEEVRRRVAETSGIVLRWEIRRIGSLAQGLTAQDVPDGGDAS